MRATWKPHEKHGELTKRADLPDSVYAFPKERKEPMTDESHVRNAAARFDQVEGVSKAALELALANIRKAARHYGVDLSEPQAATKPKRTGAQKKETAARRAPARKKAAPRKKAGAAKKK